MRRMLLLIALSLAGLATLAAQPRATYACSCAPPPPPLEARDGSVAVFAGTVREIAPAAPDGMSLLVTFDLQQTWKGPAGPQLTIGTSGSSASCGYEFTRGEPYLVYATAQGGQIQVSLCSRTAPLAAAGADLAALGPGTPVSSEGGPVTSEDIGIPWLPLALGGIAVVVALAVGVGWLRRR